VETSSFSSFAEAYNYHKYDLWNTMGRHGKVGVVTSGSAGRTTKKCSVKEEVLHKILNVFTVSIFAQISRELSDAFAEQLNLAWDQHLKVFELY
jgi:hypothetical protein